MNRLSASLLGLTVAGALALPASAADMYSGGYKDGYVPAAVWTGFYAGVNGGYGWSASSSSLYAYASDAADAVSSTSPTASIDRSGGFGGGQAGYNLQMNRLVLGLEADIQGTDMTASASANTKAGAVVADAHREISLDWFGTVRGRFGYS
jgi:outer membrane immunogenic protein